MRSSVCRNCEDEPGGKLAETFGRSAAHQIDRYFGSLRRALAVSPGRPGCVASQNSICSVSPAVGGGAPPDLLVVICLSQRCTDNVWLNPHPPVRWLSSR